VGARTTIAKFVGERCAGDVIDNDGLDRAPVAHNRILDNFLCLTAQERVFPQPRHEELSRQQLMQQFVTICSSFSWLILSAICFCKKQFSSPSLSKTPL
jgi:hypothetical protein